MSVAAILLKTTVFAAEKHINQRRKNATKSPYINHPIGVAEILACEGNVTDLVTLQAALLHDTVEDTQTTPEEIETIFGKEVCDVVREVTDDKSLPKEQRKMLQVTNASKKSARAKLVKLADKLHNLRDILLVPPPWSPERIQGYFIWSKAVTDGLKTDEFANVVLRHKLDELFTKVIPPGDTAALLEQYYRSMSVATD